MNFYGFDNLHNVTGYTYDETLDLHFAQNRFYDSLRSFDMYIGYSNRNYKNLIKWP